LRFLRFFALSHRSVSFGRHRWPPSPLAPHQEPPLSFTPNSLPPFQKRLQSEPATVVHAPWEGSGALLDRSFAVVQISGAQHKVTPGDVVIVPRVHAAVVGSEFALEDVLLVGSATRTVIGRPLVPAAKVVAMCEEHSRTKKVIVFKKKRRKGYQRTRGFRQHVTVFRIDRIECDLDAFAWPKPGDVPDPAQALAAAKAAPPHTVGEGAVASDMVDSITRAE
jgi:ribosomal protein L21